MKAESIVVGVAGALFGLLVGWVIGSQQLGPSRVAPVAAAPASAQMAPAGSQPQAPRQVDEARVQALKATAQGDPGNAQVRVDLGNLYFDAERFGEAVPWYTAALTANPKSIDASTDLGICYYYLDQPDRALKQFDYSLAIDPKHTKTLLNQGIVRAFGKQDLQGAIAAWEALYAISPDTEEGKAAKRALDSLKSAHPAPGGSAMPGAPPAKPGL